MAKDDELEDRPAQEGEPVPREEREPRVEGLSAALAAEEAAAAAADITSGVPVMPLAERDEAVPAPPPAVPAPPNVAPAPAPAAPGGEPAEPASASGPTEPAPAGDAAPAQPAPVEPTPPLAGASASRDALLRRARPAVGALLALLVLAWLLGRRR